MSIVLDGTTGITTPAATATGLISGATNYTGFKSRIINGNMAIDQRNAGASVTQTTADLFPVDRWIISGTVTSKFTGQQNAGSVTPPAGFVNYLGITSSSEYTVGAAEQFFIRQKIEGFNVADFGWGTANASTVTLSFWVRSSLTGTFGGSILNSAQNRSYPFTYTISVANTWEQKSITVAGDTSGTWLTTNGVGMFIFFGLGVGATNSGTAGAWSGSTYFSATGATSVVGTSGATFYITGVQLEKGSTATSFDYRPYGTELALCQRYYYKYISGVNAYGIGWNTLTTKAYIYIALPVSMRTAPTSLEQNGTATHYRIAHANTVILCSAVPTFDSATPYSASTIFTVASGLTAGQGSGGFGADATSYLAWSAEL